MAGTNTLTSRTMKYYNKVNTTKWVEIVQVDWVADAAAATVPNLSIDLYGFVLKVITNPGATAPTANYDIALGDPEDSTLDALGGALADRSASTTEQKAPVLSGATSPVFLAGTYTLSVSNNSVNSATGRIIFYLVEG